LTYYARKEIKSGSRRSRKDIMIAQRTEELPETRKGEEEQLNLGKGLGRARQA